MNGWEQNGFCPRCGSAVRDGICQSCGFILSSRMPDTPARENGGNLYPNDHYISRRQQGNPGRETQYRASSEKRNKDDNTLVIALVAGIGISVLVLIVLFVLIIIGLIYYADQEPKGERETSRIEVQELPAPEDFGYDYEYGYEQEAPPYGERDTQKEKADGEYYGGLEDAQRSDLSYSVEWKDFQYDTDYDNVEIKGRYPQISDDVPNSKQLNAAIFAEIQFWVDSFEEYEQEGYYFEEDTFEVKAYAYITYMSEDIISIVFDEYGTTDYSTVFYLYSINIDIKNGVVVENSNIIDMDDEFAVDFRQRNDIQNGNGYLDGMSDQELSEYLNSPTEGIVFYTPLGLEVGVNCGGGWCTVTYTDYEKYLKKL